MDGCASGERSILGEICGPESRITAEKKKDDGEMMDIIGVRSTINIEPEPEPERGTRQQITGI